MLFEDWGDFSLFRKRRELKTVWENIGPSPMLPALSTSDRCNDSDESNIEAKSHMYLIAGSRISKRRRSSWNFWGCLPQRKGISFFWSAMLLTLWLCSTKEKATEQHYLDILQGVSRDQKRYSLTSSVSKTFTAEGKETTASLLPLSWLMSCTQPVKTM